MMPPSPNHTELMGLLNAVWDEGMDEQIRARIEELLTQDREAAVQALVAYSRMHLDLEMLISSDVAHRKALELVTRASKRVRNRNWVRHHGRVVAGMGIAAAVLVAVVSFWNTQPVGHKHLLRAPQPVGRVARLDDVVWEGETTVQVGAPLVEGQTFELRQGFAQLSMGFGADVLLQGPCRAQIVSSDRVALRQGNLGVRAAEWAVGFKVETDDLVATDLGTWFSVRAGAGDAEVHVVEGIVLADPIKVRNAVQQTRRVAADEAVGVTGTGTLQPIEFRREVAAAELRKFDPLRPVKMWNTGISLKIGEEDPHWKVTAGEPQGGPYPQPAIVSAPHGSYGVNQPDRSQWISVERGTIDGAPARSHYTFETSFDLTGFDLGSVLISGLVLADDGVDEVWLNDHQLDIKPWKDWGYGVKYVNFHPIEIRSGFVPGVNRLAFVVKNETFIYRSERGFDLPETPNPMALRVEWQAFGRPLQNGPEN